MESQANTTTRASSLKQQILRGLSIIYYYSWSYIFGVPYLVYYIGTNFNTLTTEVSFLLALYLINRYIEDISQQVHSHRRESYQATANQASGQEELRNLYLRIGTHLEGLGSELTEIKEQLRRVQFNQRSAGAHLRGLYNRTREQGQQTSEALAGIVQNQYTISRQLQFLSLPGGRRPSPADYEAADNLLAEVQQERQGAYLESVSSPNSEEGTLLNDYSGNEEQHPDSPPGSPRTIESESSTSSSSSSEGLEVNHQTSGSEDDRIRRGVRLAVRRSIRDIIYGGSSASSEYSDSDSSSAGDPFSGNYS